MTNNTRFYIAVGQSAKSKFWKNISYTWSDFVDRAAQVVRTHETYATYIGLSKDEQGVIKDVGGFVGGYLDKGRRKPENVISRQLLTLDLDFAPVDFWQHFKMFYNCAAVMHSTHKHAPNNPRYRIIVPLDREVTTSEYEAIARKFAELLNIEYFDPTTFESNRLMFWASCSKDAEFIFERQDGAFLSADYMLGLYKDWRNIGEWSFSSKKNPLKGEHLNKAQENPCEKKGIVGLFCRAFTIEEAINEFLSDIYTPVGSGRYSYANGTTAGGAIVYEDGLFLYSHHATDPAGCMLCNAFDLVRIHKYGQLDAGDPALSGRNAKSYKQMAEFARGLRQVKTTAATEARKSINSAFSPYAKSISNEPIDTEIPTQKAIDFKAACDIFTPFVVQIPKTNIKTSKIKQDPPKTPVIQGEDWLGLMDVDDSGKYQNTDNNISLILRNDEYLKDCFAFNRFDNKRYVIRSLPWRGISEPEPIRDVDYSGVRNYIGMFYGITAVGKIDDALALEFERKNFHPVQDYLNGLTWDGVPRVDALLIRCFGTDNNIYTREAIRKSLCAAVARAYYPGAKYDNVLTLVGVEGTKKSTFFKKLGGRWFSDSFNAITGRESFEQLQGAWIIEMGELAGLRKAEVEQIKHYITKTEDTFRIAYGRTVETFKRSCVFFATTNDRTFLKSTTGNRRFMPIDVHPERVTLDVFSDEFEEIIPQIWAECKALYLSGEPLFLSVEANAIANRYRQEHTDTDERAGMFEEFINTLLPVSWDDWSLEARRNYFSNPLMREQQGVILRNEITVAEIWCECLGRNKEDMNRNNTREINHALRQLPNLEFINTTKRFNFYGKQRYYEIKRPV